MVTMVTTVVITTTGPVVRVSVGVAIAIGFKVDMEGYGIRGMLDDSCRVMSPDLTIPLSVLFASSLRLLFSLFSFFFIFFFFFYSSRPFFLSLASTNRGRGTERAKATMDLRRVHRTH